MSKSDTTTNLDFTAILAAKPKPSPAPALPKKLPEEIVIGAKALKKGGYFVNITNPRLKVNPRPATPTILIVEDEPDTLVLIGRVLEKEGYRTRKAATGATFVTAIKQVPVPDLILLDLELPDVSGVVILTKLRAHPGTKSIPIVVLSAHSEPKDVYQCMSLGADGYISKPTKASILVQAVKAVLGG
jgi:CheY-like chemotaxis protein